MLSGLGSQIWIDHALLKCTSGTLHMSFLFGSYLFQACLGLCSRSVAFDSVVERDAQDVSIARDGSVMSMPPPVVIRTKQLVMLYITRGAHYLYWSEHCVHSAGLHVHNTGCCHTVTGRLEDYCMCQRMLAGKHIYTQAHALEAFKVLANPWRCMSMPGM